MNIETIAEAIRRADESAGEYEFPIGGSVWYNRLAVAAVEAMGLTEQWSVEIELGVLLGSFMCEPTSFPPRGELADGDVVFSRLVSPWVQADQ